jgi:hypothetical protein
MHKVTWQGLGGQLADVITLNTRLRIWINSWQNIYGQIMNRSMLNQKFLAFLNLKEHMEEVLDVRE